MNAASSNDDPRLTRLQELQLRFCDAVRTGAWIDAARLQDERFALIDAVLAGPAKLDPGMADALRGIVRTDRELMPTVTAALDDTAAQLRELRGARKALNAYTHP